jgi:hypothetical protein
MRLESCSAPFRRLNEWGILFVLWSCFSGWTEKPALAHTTSISYSEIQIQEKQVGVRLRMNLYELNFATHLDKNSDRFLSDEEVKNSFFRFAPQLFDNFQIRGQGKLGTASLEKWKFVADTGELECLLTYSFSQILEDVRFKVTLHRITDSGHLDLALLQYDGQQEQRFFNLENSDAGVELHRGWMSYLRQGTRFLVLGGRRILTAYDYLAFLLGMFLVGQTSSARLKVAGAFALSQALTFLIGALGIATLPSRFVGSAIALSVAYIAVENLLLKEITNRWLVGCFFGLIYGFSTSMIVREWDIPRKGRLASLLTFNLGAILAVGIIVALVSLAFSNLNRFHWQKRVTTWTSLILMCFGFFWFIRRTF